MDAQRRSDSRERLAAQLATLCCLLMVAACSTPVVRSTPIVGPQAAASASSPSITFVQKGLVYALPKAQVRLTAQRKQVDAEDVAVAIKLADDANAAAKKIAERFEEAKRTLREAEAADKDKPADNPASADELSKQKGIAQAWVNVLTKRVAEANAKAAQARADRDLLSGNLGNWVDIVSLTFLPHVPDPRARFVLTHETNIARDDALKVTVKDGLLNTTAATSIDQSATVLINLAQAAAIKGAKSDFKALFSNRTSAIERIGPSGCVASELVETFDPTDLLASTRAATRLDTHSASSLSLQIDGDSVCGDGSGSKCNEAPKAAGATAERTLESTTLLDGYVYRSPRALTVAVVPSRTVQACSPKLTRVLVEATATVADSRTAFLLPITAPAFVKSKTDYAFKDGMPLEMSLDAPSQLAAISSLPLAIVKAVIEVPASIIKLRVDYDNQAVALTEAKTKLAKAQLDLQKAREDLEAATD